jgi:beta-N-acetylhexosaminidase
MGGFLKWFPRGEAELECFKSGVDMMLWPELAYFDNMEKAINNGEIPISRLDDAVNRILNLKEKLGLLSESPKKYEISTEKDNYIKVTDQEVAEQSITLIRDSKNRLPLEAKSLKKVRIISVTHYEPAIEMLKSLVPKFAELGITAEFDTCFTRKQLTSQENDYDLFIYALYARPHHPFGTMEFRGDQLENLWGSLCAGRDKIIAVAFGNPYFLTDYFENCDLLINAYSLVPSTIQAFVDAIFGKITMMGKSPVQTNN